MTIATRRWLTWISLAAVLLLVGAAGWTAVRSQSPATSAKLKIGFLTNGPINDWGYNYAHDQARLELEKSLGSKVETSIVENVPETADAERVMERMIQSGTRMIVATSFGYQDTVVKLAPRYRNVQFAQAWGFKSQPNVGFFSAKMYEAWYVMGVVAGKTTKSNRLGIVAAHPIPPMNWQINAFVLGARSVNPNVTASVVFINHWFDAGLASEATSSLIEQGADVVTGILDNSVAVAQTAQKRGAYLIGHNADLTQFAPTRILTGTRWLWAPLYENITNDVLAGTALDGKQFVGGLNDKVVGYSAYTDLVSTETKAAANAAAEKIRSGQFAVYSGPTKDNKGTVQIKPGQVLSHDEIMGMGWLVEGVR